MSTLEDKARKAIDELFGDTSVSLETTLASLKELRAQLDLLIVCLKEDIKRELEIDCGEAEL